MNIFKLYGRPWSRLPAGWLGMVALLIGASAAFADVLPALSAGNSHMLALRSDGTVWTWGDNSAAQLGDATLKQGIIPGQVAGISGAVAVSAGDSHNLVLLANGEVWAWGSNRNGQLGDGTQTTRALPLKVQGLADVIGVAAGGFSSLALKKDGTVWAWGLNSSGQLGLGTTSDVAVPYPIPGLSDVVGIAACHHANGCGVAVKRDGTVWTWGNNQSGQLGDGTNNNRAQPVQVAVSNVSRVSAGEESIFAQRGDGSVWAWGMAASRILGEEFTNNLLVPTPIPALQGVRHIAGGHGSALGVAPDGSLLNWGSLDATDLGDGYLFKESAPVILKGAPQNPLAVAAGQWIAGAVAPDGTVWSWGNNGYGQLGRGLLGTLRATPRKVANLKAATVAVGNVHNLVIVADGTVWAWGNNTKGILGVDGVASSATPIAVSGVSGKAKAVAACPTHSLALTEAGEVYAWGNNENGQLGDGTLTQRNLPIRIADLSNIAAIGCGVSHSVALGQDGRVWAWGSQVYYPGLSTVPGAIYNPASEGSAKPLAVAGLGDIRAIAVGGYFNLALAGDGTVYSWGRNDAGQLGDGTLISRLTPKFVLGGASGIAAGFAHAYARTAGGKWFGWGRNSSGQLGIGDVVDRLKPEEIAFAVDFSSLSANGGEVIAMHGGSVWGQTLGVTVGGEVWGWGNNREGELGNDIGGLRMTPKALTGLPPVVQIAAGKEHTLAVSQSGEIWSWGNSSESRLGQIIALNKPGMAVSADPETPFRLMGSAAIGLIAHADISGQSATPTISAALSVAAADKGKTGKLYAAYLLPNGLLYFLTSTGWVRYDGAALPVYAETTLGEHSLVLWPGKALSGMGNAVFYIGYGLSENDLLENRKYSAIHTVEGN